MDNLVHVNAGSLDDAVAQLAKGGAEVCAGGTDLMSTLKGFISDNLPTTIVNIKQISGLSYIKEDGGMLKIGALTTLDEIANSSVVASKCAALAQAAGLVASPEIRNVGTIGGNICQRPRCIYYRNEYNDFNCARKGGKGGCYALTGLSRYHSIFGLVNGCMAVCPSDTAPVLVAAGAKIVTTKKTWAAADFFKIKGEKINSLDADEIVTEIQVPTGKKSCYKKFAFRKSFDFPLVSCAVVGDKVVLGGVYNSPYEVSGDTVKATSATAYNKYKEQIANTLIKRAKADVK